MKNSYFYMWGERGIVATFFAEMHLWAAVDDWLMFLRSLSVPDPRFPRSLDSVTVIVEPDFGNKGFGHPDAVLLLTSQGESFVVIAEAKRKRFAQSCRKVRGDKFYNSTLKGQLELNYILTLALVGYQGADAPLAEPGWIRGTPYRTGNSECIASLKNKVVLRSIVRQLAGFLCIEKCSQKFMTRRSLARTCGRPQGQNLDG
jgi:hypothetical protein